MIRIRTEGSAGSREALGLLLAASPLLTTARPAHASTAFTVDSDADTDDGTCDATNCTLREAIDAAAAGADPIRFAIPDNPFIPGFEVKTISPSSPLPEIIDPVTMDGYTQPGTSENTKAIGDDAVLLVELNGEGAGSAVGLKISFPASGTTVRGLVFNRFSSSGVEVLGTDNKVEGNFIGTDSSGATDLGNNVDGVRIFGTNNTIGGISPEARNVISGNDEDGIFLFGSGTGDNKIEGNFIGTKKDGAGNLGNANGGVLIDGTSNNTVGGVDPKAANTIAFNGGDGVTLITSIFSIPIVPTGDSVLGNSIFSNGQEGIDLGGNELELGGDGRTNNDAGDADTGPNNLQNFPVLDSAKTSRRAITIQGKLNSTPGTTFTILLFANASESLDEGEKFIGQEIVTTDEGGDASLTFKIKKKVPKGQFVTAATTDPYGNTSEFSDPREVVKH